MPLTKLPILRQVPFAVTLVGDSCSGWNPEGD